MSDDVVGLAHTMLDAAREKGYTPTGWPGPPRPAVRVGT